MTTKIRDLVLQDDIMDAVECEVKKIRDKQKANSLEDRDVVILEKLAKIYSTVMGSHRENLKYGVYGDLEEGADGLGDTDDSTNADEDAD